METTLILPGLVLAAAAAAAFLWWRSRKEDTVFDYQRGLLFHKGRFSRVMEAGTYQLSRQHDQVIKMDMRPVLFTVPGQEMLTLDKISIKVTAGGTYIINDPHVAFSQAMSYNATLYADAQTALRDVIQSLDLETVLGDKSEINTKLHSALGAKTAVIGLSLRDIAIRDVMLPAGLKKAYGGLLEAQKDAQIAVEKARSEQAVLRSLANSSRLYAEHPALLSARIVQALDTGEHTIMLHAGGEIPTAFSAKKHK